MTDNKELCKCGAPAQRIIDGELRCRKCDDAEMDRKYAPPQAADVITQLAREGEVTP
jgi:hypothetical protein